MYLLKQERKKPCFIRLMIYLEFLDGQGLGNQLWNYVSLRSLSNKLGFGYQIINPDKFKGKTFLEISYSEAGNKKYSKKYLKNHNYKYIFNEKLYYDNSLKTFISDFDKEILKIKSFTLIRGLFQSEKYLFDNNINQFIRLKNLNKNGLKNLKNKCLLNIRGGEYKRFKNLILPKTYWMNAIENMKKINPNIEFYVVTDDYDYAANLLPELKIIKGKINEDFINLFYAEYLIVSNSSFSYFPISLGRKPKKIIAPSNWARFGNPQGKWISPSNYYKNWSYQNEKGEIIPIKNIEKSIKNTREFYAAYNILTTKDSISNKTIFSFLPRNLRKNIKKILAKFFPLYIG